MQRPHPIDRLATLQTALDLKLEYLQVSRRRVPEHHLIDKAAAHVSSELLENPEQSLTVVSGISLATP